MKHREHHQGVGGRAKVDAIRKTRNPHPPQIAERDRASLRRRACMFQSDGHRLNEALAQTHAARSIPFSREVELAPRGGAKHHT